ncbi:MAG: endopeptidase La [Chloroflexota bacterium]
MAQLSPNDGGDFEEWLGEEFDAPNESLDHDLLAVLPLRDSVIFPGTVMPLLVGRERSMKAVEAAMAKSKRLIAITQRDEEVDEPEPEDLFGAGTEIVIGRRLRMPDGTVSILVQGQRRVHVERFAQVEPYLIAQVSAIDEGEERGLATEALMRAVLALFEKVLHLSRNLPENAYVAAVNAEGPGALADLIASVLDLSIDERQELLEVANATERLQKISLLLAAELDVLELENQIQSQVQQEIDKSQREYFLREQMRVIQSELGENDPFTQEVNELRTKMEAASLPDEVRVRADKELSRLSSMPAMSPETGVIRTYLDWILALPWTKLTEDNLDIPRAARILDETHYGLPKAKERIIEHIAVYQLAQAKMKNPILCFVGPPGTGKTSLGQSIARSLGREFVRVSLGGVRDEAEIRGHRRTYVGALPGRIIQTMRRAGVKNPVFMLDEIDKLGLDFRGDPASALLEVLDPEQNYAFSDHFMELAFDLSKVMFITTANTLDPVPPALLDRMEVIEFPGYMEDEKLQIARQFLLPRQIEQNGLTRLRFAESAILGIIREYTHESGVRNLEREIANICRKVARRVAEHKPVPMNITRQSLPRYLGVQRYDYGVAEESDQVGVATGLAWTEAGGDTLSVEVTIMSGKGSLILTGQLGDIMQESAQAALSYARSRAEALEFGEIDFDKIDVHVHVPEGAVPKDGPSAGITIATALISALTGRAVLHDVTMTGEITLRGRVLPIGCLREKILAAQRAGLKTVLMPRRNRRDLSEVPSRLRKRLNLVFVESMDQVLPLALSQQRDPAITARWSQQAQ